MAAHRQQKSSQFASSRVRRKAESTKRRLIAGGLLVLIIVGIGYAFTLRNTQQLPGMSEPAPTIAEQSEATPAPEQAVAEPPVPDVTPQPAPEPETEPEQEPQQAIEPEPEQDEEPKQETLSNIAYEDEYVTEVAHDDGEEEPLEEKPSPIDDNIPDRNSDNGSMTTMEEEGEEIEIDVDSRTLLFSSDPAKNDANLADYLEKISDTYKGVDKDEDAAGSDENKVVK
ncbi:MAG: hypothetical protein Q4F35_01165 [Akkermansia sp.]|nr:hypothetical protein [Akkermansia sp.]